MIFNYNNQEYNILIEKKKTNKNTYIRVKSDMNIYVTTNFFASDKSIKKLIDDNYNEIVKMIKIQEIKQENNEGFHFLGKKYDKVYVN